MIEARTFLLALAAALESDRPLARRLAAALAVRDDDDLLPLADAAALVGISGKDPARTVRDAGRRGELEILIVGRSPRVRRSALLAWARPARVASPPASSRSNSDVTASLERAAARLRRSA